MYPLSPSTLTPARPTQEEAGRSERWQVFLTPGGLNVYDTAKRKLRVTRGEAGWESLTFKIPYAEIFTYLTGASLARSQGSSSEPSERSRTAQGLSECPLATWPRVLAPDFACSLLSIVPAAMSARSRAFRGKAGSGPLEAFDPPRLRECVRGAVTKAMGSTRAARPHAAGV